MAEHRSIYGRYEMGVCRWTAGIGLGLGIGIVSLGKLGPVAFAETDAELSCQSCVAAELKEDPEGSQAWVEAKGPCPRMSGTGGPTSFALATAQGGTYSIAKLELDVRAGEYFHIRESLGSSESQEEPSPETTEASLDPISIGVFINSVFAPSGTEVEIWAKLWLDKPGRDTLPQIPDVDARVLVKTFNQGVVWEAQTVDSDYTASASILKAMEKLWSTPASHLRGTGWTPRRQKEEWPKYTVYQVASHGVPDAAAFWDDTATAEQVDNGDCGSLLVEDPNDERKCVFVEDLGMQWTSEYVGPQCPSNPGAGPGYYNLIWLTSSFQGAFFEDEPDRPY